MSWSYLRWYIPEMAVCTWAWIRGVTNNRVRLVYGVGCKTLGLPPCSDYVSSPLGTFEWSSIGKVHTIQDLSFPPGRSVNDHIDLDQFTLSYVTVDEVAQACTQYDKSFLAKSDLTNAFKHILVNPRYWHLLGFSWQGKYYASAGLPFGCRASPLLFDQFARALQYMAIEHGMSPMSWHYLDDTITISPSHQSCQQSINIFNQMARLAGFTLQDAKCTAAMQVIEFLGIAINTMLGTLSITEQCMSEITKELVAWQGKKVCTKCELLSIIGRLAFASRVAHAGWTFLRRLIALSKTTRCLHIKVKLNKAALVDFKWWLSCIRSHNGVTMFPKDWSDSECQTIYFWCIKSSYGSSGW